MGELIFIGIIIIVPILGYLAIRSLIREFKRK